MICPHCSQENDLTWKRYLTAPLGRHVCLSCGGKFRMRHSLKYYGAVLGLWGVGGVLPGIVALELGASLVQAFYIYWIVGLCVVIPIDRKIDNSWRGAAAIGK